MKTKKLVLAFSGGLDTTYCALYLAEQGYDVHTVTIDTGGFSPADLIAIETSARAMNVSSHTCLDLTHELYDQCLRYLLATHYLKNQTYPLSVSSERFFQALAIAQFAHSIGADAIAHGSTGAGNDQVRFDAVFGILCPNMELITPIRDQALSRDAEIHFLKSRGLVKDWTKAKYSINKGLWGTTIGGVETSLSHTTLPEQAYPTAVTASEPKTISITFEQGHPVSLDDQPFSHPVAFIQALEKIAAPFGIGRDIHVGDTIIGIKGRVGFEAPAPIILIKAHHLLEKHVLTKHQIHIKDQLAQHYGQMVHEAQFLDPSLRAMEAFIDHTQKFVSGKVFLTLAPYRFSLIGIDSPHDLMKASGGTYGEDVGTWTGSDVRGFTKILALQAKLFAGLHSHDA